MIRTPVDIFLLSNLQQHPWDEVAKNIGAAVLKNLATFAYKLALTFVGEQHHTQQLSATVSGDEEKEKYT